MIVRIKKGTGIYYKGKEMKEKGNKKKKGRETGEVRRVEEARKGKWAEREKGRWMSEEKGEMNKVRTCGRGGKKI